MAKKTISEDLINKALEYRALTLEKYKITIEELESRRQTLIDSADTKAQKQELKACSEMISQIRKDIENMQSISDEMFVDVVLEKGLLLNVSQAFDKEKIEKRESSFVSSEQALDIALKRQERKNLYRKMSIEELLEIVMGNEKLEIEILKAKIAHNKKRLSEMFGAEPSSK